MVDFESREKGHGHYQESETSDPKNSKFKNRRRGDEEEDEQEEKTEE